MMNGYTLDESMNLRSLNRSPYRNMPQKCFKCAYASKNSSYGTICTSTMCPAKYKNNDEE